VGRGSIAPCDDSAARRGDTSAAAGLSDATARADGRALISRPPTELSTEASADAAGSAARTGSAGIGAAATAGAGCGVAAATGVTGGCTGTAGAAAG